MPIIPSTYNRPPWYQFNGHLQTLWPGIFREIKDFQYERYRLELEDGDFLDLDWKKNDSEDLIIIAHGLEGHSERPYVMGLAKLASSAGWDILAWNCRSCSGEMNRLPKMYYHGDTADQLSVLDYARGVKPYKRIVLTGFSMGGAIVLKTLGKHAQELPAEVVGGLAYSVPCDLSKSAESLDWKKNRLYKKRFLNKLATKFKAKNDQFPGMIDVSKIEDVDQWIDFDEWFSAPMNGFRDAAEFYYNGSCKNWLDGVQVPTLLMTAHNDPIIPQACIPVEQIKAHDHVHLMMSQQGGHVGFMEPGTSVSHMELAGMAFLNEHLA